MVLQSQDRGLEVLAAAEARLHAQAFAVVAVLPVVLLPYVRPAEVVSAFWSVVLVLPAEPLFATTKPLSLLPARLLVVLPGPPGALPATCTPCTEAAPATSSLSAAPANKLAGANPLQPRWVRDRAI